MSTFPTPSAQWGTLGWHVMFGEEMSEDDADEDSWPAPTGNIGRIEGFTMYASPPAAFDVEASIPPKQIVHGPQRKGRGGKIKKW